MQILENPKQALAVLLKVPCWGAVLRASRLRHGGKDWARGVYSTVFALFIANLVLGPNLVVANERTLSAAPPPQTAQSVDSDPFEIVFDIYLRETPRISSSIGFEQGDRLYIDLKDFADALDFPIVVNIDGRSAKGWFVQENRDFLLDMTGRRALVDGNSYGVSQQDVIADNGALYVSQKVLSTWFPVDLAYDPRQLALVATPREALPIEKRLAKRPRTVRPRQSPQKAVLPRTEDGYKAYDMPTIDLTLSQQVVGDDDDVSARTGYVVSSAGDLLYGTTRFFGVGSTDDSISTGRLSWERAAPEGQLLEGVPANRVVLGDVSTVTLKDMMGSSIERGILVENGALGQTIGGGTTEFVGSVEPGYVVELYRNGILLETQEVANDGLYEFRDVTLFSGRNAFELVFLGPQGQRRTETKTLFFDSDAPDQGKVSYNLSLSQDNKSLLLGAIRENQRESGTLRAGGSARIGLSENLSLQTRGASYEFDSKRHNYISFGLRGALDGVYGALDGIYDTESGYGLTAETQFNLFSVNVRGTQRFFFDEYRTENRLTSSSQTDSETELQISGGVPIVKGWSLPYVFSGQWDERENDSHELNLRLRTSLYSPYFSFQNALNWRDDSATSSEEQVMGNALISKTWGPVNIRAGLGYSLGRDSELTELSLRMISMRLGALSSMTLDLLQFLEM